MTWSERVFFLNIRQVLENPVPEKVHFVLPRTNQGLCFQQKLLGLGAFQFAFFDDLKHILNLVPNRFISVTGDIDFRIIKENLEKNPERKINVFGEDDLLRKLEEFKKSEPVYEPQSESKEPKEQKHKFTFTLPS